MASALAVRDHRELQSAALRTAAAGAAAGLLHALFPGPLTDALALCALGISAVPPRSWRSAAIAALLACAGAGAAALPLGPGLILLAGCGAALYARDAGGAGRSLVAGVAGVGALAAGLFVAEGLRAGLLVGLAAPLSWMAAGGAAGLCAGLGVVGRELEWRPVLPTGEPAHATLPPPATAAPEGGELGQLLGRAAVACRQARESLGEEAPAAARAASDLLERIGAFSQRWRDLDRQLGGLERASLVERAERMAERARAAVDDEVRDEYLRAERALRQQIDDLDAIRGWQERSLARLYHHVAVLERLRLAAIHRRSVATGRSGDELSALVDELSTAGLELDGAAEILAELPAASS
jgi:hypothetical protein